MTTYYVKNGGNNSLNGQTPTNAWETLAKVNSVTLNQGDKVLFNRGDTWRESVGLRKSGVGVVGNPVIFGAYGTGALPVIDHGLDLSATGSWTRPDPSGKPNIWQATAPYQIGQLLLDWNTATPSAGTLVARGGFCEAGGTATTIELWTHVLGMISNVDDQYNGAYLYCPRCNHTDHPHQGENRLITDYIGGSTKRAIVASGSSWDTNDAYYLYGTVSPLMSTDGAFCWDPVNGKVYLYLAGGVNPATVYDGIVGTQRIRSYINGATPNATTSFIVEDLEFTLSCDDCVLQAGPNSIIRRSKFSWLGGEWDVENGYRDGYGIMFWTACNNVEVSYCTFYEIFNNALSWQYGHMDNHKIHHNLFVNMGGGCNELWPVSATYSNFVVVNNTAYNNGLGIIGSQMHGGTGVTTSEFFSKVGAGSYPGLVIENNICSSSEHSMRFFAWSLNDDTAVTDCTMDYNCWHPDHTDAYKYNPNNLLDSLADWQSMSGVDANSINDDPLFVDADNLDFHLEALSPCRGAGVFVEGINSYDPPSMGMYEETDAPAATGALQTAAATLDGSGDVSTTGTGALTVGAARISGGSYTSGEGYPGGEAGVLDLEVHLEMINRYALNDDAGDYNLDRSVLLLDPAHYDGATYYFEIVARNQGNSTITVSLVKSADSTVMASIDVPTSADDSTRLRSASFTPATGPTEYKVRLEDYDGGYLWLYVSRVIVVQKQATKTRLQVPLFTSYTQAFIPPGATPAASVFCPIWLKDNEKFAAVLTCSLEGMMAAPSSTTTATMGLYSKTSGLLVAGSEASVTGATLDYCESSGFLWTATNFTDDEEFEVRYSHDHASWNGKIDAAWLYITLTDLAAAQVVHRVTCHDLPGEYPVSKFRIFYDLDNWFTRGACFFEATGYKYNGRRAQATLCSDDHDSGDDTYSPVCTVQTADVAGRNRVRTTAALIDSKRYWCYENDISAGFAGGLTQTWLLLEVGQPDTPRARVDLEIPLQMGTGLVESTDATHTFPETILRLNPADYDGTVSFYWELVYYNDHTTTDVTATLVDYETGTTVASQTMTLTHGDETDVFERVRGAAFTPLAGVHLYALKLTAGWESGIHTCEVFSRIFVKQHEATKTRVQIPLMGDTSALLSGGAPPIWESAREGILWLKTEANWDGVTECHVEGVMEGYFGPHDCFIGFYNYTDDQQVAATNAVSLGSDEYGYGVSNAFAWDATYFDEGDEFEMRGYHDDNLNFYVHSAYLYVTLESLKKCEVYVAVVGTVQLYDIPCMERRWLYTANDWAAVESAWFEISGYDYADLDECPGNMTLCRGTGDVAEATYGDEITESGLTVIHEIVLGNVDLPDKLRARYQFTLVDEARYVGWHGADRPTMHGGTCSTFIILALGTPPDSANVTGTGALQTAPVQLEGSGPLAVTGSGTLTPGSCQLAGSGSFRVVNTSDGRLRTAAVKLSGTGTSTEAARSGTGALTVSGARIQGDRAYTGYPEDAFNDAADVEAELLLVDLPAEMYGGF